MAATFVLLALSAGYVQGKSASEWVTQSRQSGVEYSTAGKIKFDVSGDGPACRVTANKGGQPAQTLQLKAGVGNIVEVCSNGPDTHYFRAEELFRASAFRKVESSSTAGSVNGYVAQSEITECISKNGGCCAAYIVPITPGSYQVNDPNCATPLGTIEVTGPSPGQLEDADPARQLLQQDLPPDTKWNDASTKIIDIALVQQASCGPAAAVPGGRRRLYQQGPSEGDGEDAAGSAFNLRFVYSQGHTSVATDLLELPDVENAKQPAAPAPTEGTDGVAEGEGEGRVSASPGAGEGADNNAEGGGEGGGEGADNVFEGGGEGGGEGADNVFEGGSEGGSEGEGAAAPEDAGEGESESEGAASRRLSQATPAPVEGEGADGIVEGAGEGVSTASFLAIEAEKHPIEMVAGQPYKLRFRLIGSTANHYFSAPEFFMASHVAQFVDDLVAYKFHASPVEYELFGDESHIIMWVQPKTAGMYSITSGRLPASQVKPASIKVVGGAGQLTDPGQITASEVAGACGANQTPDAQGTPVPVVAPSPAPPAGATTPGQGAAQPAPPGTPPASPDTATAPPPDSSGGLVVGASLAFACLAGVAFVL